MWHLSGKKFLFWIGSSCLLLTFSCVRRPTQAPNLVETGKVVYTLFRVTGRVNGQSLSGIRAYLQVDSTGAVMVNLLTALNSPLSVIYYDGNRLVLVDYRARRVFIDRTSPFNLGPEVPFPIDIVSLAKFYRKTLKRNDVGTETFSWGKLLRTANGQIVALFNNGSRLLLTPLSGPKSKKGARLSLKIPAGYRQTNAGD